MPLRSKLIIFAVVVLIVFAGLAVGSYTSLSAASREAEQAREELEKLSLVEGLLVNCQDLGDSPDPGACARAYSALVALEEKAWRPEGKARLEKVLVLAASVKDARPPEKPEMLRDAVAQLRDAIVEQVGEDLRSAQEPTHKRAIRLLVSAALLAIGGSATFAFLYSRLIRERRSLEERVRRSEKLAALATLAAGIAHEINNPLATIAMSAEALAERLPPDEETKRFLEAIEEEAIRCRNIIGDLSDLARGGSLDREPVEVDPLCANAVRIVERNASLPAARLKTRIQEGLPLLSADRGKLLQVLVNLIRNGVEAAGQGGSVFVTAESRDGKLLVSVDDDGQGISPSRIDRIFEPFFTSKETGVGLGLSLCHRIAELHGGTILVESEGEGSGSTFTLVLPLEDRNGE